MSRFIEIDGRQYLWREVLQKRREQLAEGRRAQQPALFLLREDSRPKESGTASGRYLAPSLFEGGLRS